MIKALKNKSTIITTAIVNFIILAFFITNSILEQVFIIELPYNFPVVLVFILVVLLLVAFLIGDVSATRYRKKNKLWAGPLPEEIKQHIRQLRMPWLIAIGVTIIIGFLDTLLWRI